MDKIKNLSIRKTIILYMALAATAGFLLGTLLMDMADRVQQSVWRKYADEEYYQEMMREQESRGYVYGFPRPNASEMSGRDHQISEVCDFFETYSILLLSAAGIVIAAFLFYRNKISRPLTELTAASEKIAANELDFQVAYVCRDELGTLCGQFETMRQALYDNNVRMWRMVEEQKTLRAAVAHDIRAPLAVLCGYQEMLLEFVPQDRLDREALLEILQDGMEEIEALGRFVETMRKLSSLEEREPVRKNQPLTVLEERLRRSLHEHEKQTGKKAALTAEVQTGQDAGVRERKQAADVQTGRNIDIQAREACIDADMIAEAAENLFANAFVHARRAVTVELLLKERTLEIAVRDDGSGFTEDTDTVTRAYYRGASPDGLEHFGLGMYISRLYCEKHGGRLLTGNAGSGGAVVTAVFAI